MSTRAAIAREAAFLASSVKDNAPVLQTGAATKRRRVTADKENFAGVSPTAASSGGSIYVEGDVTVASAIEASEDPGVSKPTKTRKRKINSSKKEKRAAANAEPVKGGWDELPHNIGKIKAEPASGDATIRGPEEMSDLLPNKKRRIRSGAKVEDERDEEDASLNSFVKNNTKILKQETNSPARKVNNKTKAATLRGTHINPVIEELEQDLETDVKVGTVGTQRKKIVAAKPKTKQLARTKKMVASHDVEQKLEELVEASAKPVKTIRKGKANPYGLTPGISPFPNFVMPTLDACKQVEDALSDVHGKVEAPTEIPAPSLEVTGCGEVPSVLDALIRTRLSASTTSQNAKYAFTGLVERYGVLESGIGAGSVDWNKVRASDVLDIEKAIKKGGLAKTKSISIKKILNMVRDQNEIRREAFIAEKAGGEKCEVVGAEKMTQGQKDMEIDVANKKILSLDFMHGLTADEAMIEFVKFPGIGVKTASCVILFCLQRPSFAVDTHVWRFCKWLKWVPEGATRDQTFSHCEVRIPNDMKYSLHQLFIRHGKTCGRCRAITGEGSDGWETTICPLEHLVERTGKKKATGPPMKPAKGNKKILKSSNGKKGQRSEKVDEWQSGSDSNGEDAETTTSGEE